ncbi:MAG: YggT family protein [Nitrospinota bacterium]|nr:MAG: YggT family protein [Nitrospinota bacterium]
MFIIGNLLGAIAGILDTVLYLYMLVIIARALISWVNPDPYNPIVRFLYQVTEPVLSWVRRTIPSVAAGIDFSPFIVILLIYFIQSFLVGSLRGIAIRLQ